jgi:hypothetical protein
MPYGRIIREISHADKRTFYQFRNIEYPKGNIARSLGMYSQRKTTTGALVP